MQENLKPFRNALLGLLAVLIILLLFIRLAPFSYIWVMDNGQNLNKDFLIKLCPDGTRLVEIQFGQSGAIAYDPLNGYLWAPELNDLGDINQDQLVKFDQDGNLLARYEGYRTGKIAIDPNDGAVWVGLVNEGQVVKLNAEGEQILAASGIESPYAIVVDPRDSSLWVADGGIRHLIHFDREGEEFFRVPTKGFFSNTPHQLAVDPVTGNIWYSGSFDERVYMRAAYGEPLTIVEGFDRPVAIAVDPRDSSAWVADFSTDASGGIVKLDATGELILKKVLDSPPWSVGFNPFDETVWVGLDGSLVVLSSTGDIRHTFSEYTQPKSFAFVGVPNRLPDKLEFIQTCLLGTGEEGPRQFLKDTPTVNPNQPVIVTPSPVPTYTPTATPLPTVTQTPSITPSPTSDSSPTPQPPSVNHWREIEPYFSDAELLEKLNFDSDIKIGPSWRDEPYAVIMGWTGLINGVGTVKFSIDENEWNSIVLLGAFFSYGEDGLTVKNIPITACVSKSPDPSCYYNYINVNPTESDPGTPINTHDLDAILGFLQKLIGAEIRNFLILPGGTSEPSIVFNGIQTEIWDPTVNEFIQDACSESCYLFDDLFPVDHIYDPDILEALDDPWGLFVQGSYIFIEN